MYIDPIKGSAHVLTQEWALAKDTIVLCMYILSRMY